MWPSFLDGKLLLLIDFDGPLTRLLPDPEQLRLADRLADWLRAHGLEPPAAGDHVHLLRYVAENRPQLAEAAEQFCTAAELAAAGRQEVYPAAVQVIAEWLDAGGAAAVVSNNSAQVVRLMLDRTSLAGRVSVHARTASGLERLKPRPDLLLDALREHDCQPHQAVMIGDTVSDLQAAAAARVVGIGLATSLARVRALLDAGAIGVIAELADLARRSGRALSCEAGPPEAPDPAGDVWSELLSGRVPGLSDDPLVDLYGPIVTAGPLVIAQLGQSLDGFIASRTGDAQFVTGSQDRVRLHRMRALMDAVVVGVGTVTADNPRLTVRDVPGPNPVRVVIDPRARTPLDAHVLTSGDARTLWLIGPSAVVVETPATHVEVVRLSTDDLADPGTVLALLAERGLRRVLVEGGGRLVSSFVAARVVDRLYLTTAPLLIGDGVPGLRFAGQDALRDALRGRCRRFQLGPDECTELILREPEPPPGA